MAETEPNGDSTNLENTPTWAVAVVCFILISVSILIEHGLHILAKHMQKKRKKSVRHALDKIKSDLMLLGFISLLLTVAHFTQETDFNFRKYLKRVLEKDFGVVAGMSLWIWMFSVHFIFFNAYVFHSYIWLPFIPLVMLLVVGTKLQAVITKTCLDSNDKSHVIRGTLLVRPSDHFFWFGQPKLLLHVMHFILFQNSFQLAFFTWTWCKFGLRSCFHRRTDDILIRLVMGVVVLILCGYVKLPLYALVTQMGTSMKNAVFPEGVVSGLERWRARAKKNSARNKNYYSGRPSLDATLDNSLDTSLSFSTLDGSLPVEQGYTNSSDDGYTSIEIGDENSDGGMQMEQHEKLGSFQGFNLGKMH